MRIIIDSDVSLQHQPEGIVEQAARFAAECIVDTMKYGITEVDGNTYSCVVRWYKILLKICNNFGDLHIRLSVQSRNEI